MQPKNWTPRTRIENEYRRLIVRLLDRYLNFPESSTLGQINEALVNFKTATDFFESAAEALARRMVTQVSAVNARSWRQAGAQGGTRGREIYGALRQELGTGVGTRVNELVAQNAQLISSIPDKVREVVNNEIAAKHMAGMRHEEVARWLRKRIPQLTESRAALIARTETGKASTSLTRARSEDLGINWYEWATSEDERVRTSHRLMDKVLVNWDDPPAPEALAGIESSLGHYHGGSAPNCRCDCYPILALTDLKWPHKVYKSGSIRMMTLAAFRQLDRQLQPAA